MTLRAKIRLAGSLGACCAAGAVAGLLAPHRTVASLVPGDPGEVGVTFGVYSYRDALCTEEADPINVIFLGNWQTVQAHAAHHGDWTTYENNQQYFFDHGHCSPNQAGASSNSASLPGEQRFHMRLRTSSTDSAGTIYDADPYWGIWTGATAHHEQRTVTGDCTKPQGEHAVDDQTVSGGSGIFAYEGGYNRARADILYNWTTLGIGNHIRKRISRAR